MNDCTNADIRDQLPELLHERLDASARAAVMAHLEECVDCREEVALLAGLRSAIETRTPRVDLNYVIEALPKPPVRGASRGVSGEPRRRLWADWRVAAAVTLLVAGGSSVALLSREQSDHSVVQSPVIGRAQTAVAAVPQPSQPSPTSPTPPRATASESASSAVASERTAEARSIPRQTEVASTATPAASRDVPVDGTLSNLNQSQLKTLLQDLDKLKAMPVAEPEPATLRISGQSTGDDIS